MSSAICFNLDQSKMLSSDNGLIVPIYIWNSFTGKLFYITEKKRSLVLVLRANIDAFSIEEFEDVLIR